MFLPIIHEICLFVQTGGNIMYQVKIELRSVRAVLDFVSLATSRSFPIRVGTEKHQVNAKSFMELFCLNLREPVTATLQCSEEEFRKFCLEADRFLAE